MSEKMVQTHNWDDLRFFLALVRGENLDSAARLLKVDESTVRRRIAGLERRFGVPLFERNGAVARTTRAGALLLQPAELIEEAIAAAETKIAIGGKSVAGTVRVGAPDGIGSLVLAPALARLRDEMPDMVIELVTLPRPADISKREVDIVLLLERPETGRHKIRKLQPVSLHFYVSRTYLRTHPPIVSLSDLSGHRILGYDPDSDYAEAAIRRLLDMGIAPDGGFICSSVFAQARAAAGGGGIALLPDYIVEPGLDLVPVLPNEISVILDLWLLTHADVASRARVRAVANVISRACSKLAIQ